MRQVSNDDVIVQLHQDRSQELEFPSFPWHKQKEKAAKGPAGGEGGKAAAAVKIRARPAEQKTLVEEDLKPEFKLKVAEWEVQKAMAGHSNRVRRITRVPLFKHFDITGSLLDKPPVR